MASATRRRKNTTSLTSSAQSRKPMMALKAPSLKLLLAISSHSLTGNSVTLPFHNHLIMTMMNLPKQKNPRRKNQRRKRRRKMRKSGLKLDVERRLRSLRRNIKWRRKKTKMRTRNLRRRSLRRMKNLKTRRRKKKSARRRNQRR